MAAPSLSTNGPIFKEFLVIRNFKIVNYFVVFIRRLNGSYTMKRFP
jgi:hypothetical protein